MTTSRERIATRTFGALDQSAFARLSGDRNPMHMDAIAARRTQAGAPVVHGVHAAIWTLDVLAAKGLLSGPVAQVAVRFSKFLFLDAALDLIVCERSQALLKAEVRSEGQSALLMTVKLGPEAGAPGRADGLAAAAETPHGAAPDEPAVEALAGLAGWLVPPSPDTEWAEAYPDAARVLSCGRLAGLGQLSRLVGMVAPGLHSIFSGFTVDLVGEAGPRRGIGFRVTTADARYRIVKADVAGSGLSGSVSAFVRAAPVAAPSVAALMAHVAPGAFADATALVVGGSRGLGAVTAKLLAAGGARVVVTYARGRADAEALAAEINGACGRGVCSALALDCRLDVAPQLASLGDAVSHLYYFATPQIFRQKSGVFAQSAFEDFSRVYAGAFFETVAALLAQPRACELRVLYPSSVFVETRPAGMTEYAMAKSAGEVLCADLARANPRLHIAVERLARVATDQTATVAGLVSADPLAVMLPLILRLHAAHEAVGRRSAELV